MNDDLNVLLHCGQTNIIPKRLKRNVNLNTIALAFLNHEVKET